MGAARLVVRCVRWFVSVVVVSGALSCRDASPRETLGGASFRRCAAVDPGGPSEHELVGRTLTRDGVVLRDPRPSAPRVNVLLLGGPYGGPVGASQRALGQRLARVGARVTVVLGGLEGDAAALSPWVDAVLPRDVPTLLVPADTESHPTLRRAIKDLAETRPWIIDGTRVRLYASRDVEVATLPGTPWHRMLRAPGDGCGLVDEDPAALAAALPPPAAPRLLATAVAPSQTGATAIDRGVLGTHVGAASVARALPTLRVRGVAAALPRESAGAVSDLAGQPRPDDAADAPFAVSVGATSSVPVETAAGAWVGPGAWVVHLERGQLRLERVP